MLIKHIKCISIVLYQPLAKLLQVQECGTILKDSKMQIRNFVVYAKCSEHPHLQILGGGGHLTDSEASKPS